MLQSSAYRTKRCPRRSSSRSSSSSTRLLSRGERGPPCGVPSTLGLTNPFSITPAFKKCPNEFPQPFVLDSLDDLPHQLVVIDPIEKLLEIKVHHPAVTFGDIVLCLGYCLMCRPPWSKTIAVIGERWVPLPLQNLQHRLLEKSVERSRDAKL